MQNNWTLDVMRDTHQQHINDFQVWEYPELNEHHTNELIIDNYTLEEAEPVENTFQDMDTILMDNTMPEVANDLHEELVIEDNRLDDKINLLDAMGAQMAEILSNVEASVLQSMVALVKQSVKKIILKELSLDEHAIKTMIEQSLDKINKDKSPCVIHVSEEDYPVFENKSYLNYVQIILDPALSQGSFIIKTKFSKLHAILEDRLTVLFGLLGS